VILPKFDEAINYTMVSTLGLSLLPFNEGTFDSEIILSIKKGLSEDEAEQIGVEIVRKLASEIVKGNIYPNSFISIDSFPFFEFADTLYICDWGHTYSE
jgi:hypothetical protein